jgi:uncharacterized membrane protein YuzA (DUF378 family)
MLYLFHIKYYKEETIMEIVSTIGLLLASIGAINWGLAGLFGIDLVALITGSKFGEVNAISRVIYGLVGLAGIGGLLDLAGLV